MRPVTVARVARVTMLTVHLPEELDVELRAAATEAEFAARVLAAARR